MKKFPWNGSVVFDSLWLFKTLFKATMISDAFVLITPSVANIGSLK